jgi:hypothetical protein
MGCPCECQKVRYTTGTHGHYSVYSIIGILSFNRLSVQEIIEKLVLFLAFQINQS